MATGSYSFGIWGEKIVRSILEARGWQTYSPPGSRGPADIFAFKEGKKWCIQVKARTVCKSRPLGKKDIQKLFQESKSCNCTAVVAMVAITGNLMRTASYVVDSHDASVIRDILGNFVAFVVADNVAIFFYDLRTGRGIEP